MSNTMDYERGYEDGKQFRDAEWTEKIRAIAEAYALGSESPGEHDKSKILAAREEYGRLLGKLFEMGREA